VDELDVLRRFQANVPEPDEATVRRVRAELMERMIGSDRSARGFVPLRGHRRRWAVATAAGVVAAALVFLLPVLVPGEPRGAQAEAAEVLNRAAAVAARQAAPAVPPPGTYRYTRSEGAYLGVWGDAPMFSVLLPRTREFWQGTDGTGRLRTRFGEAVFLGERDRARWEAAGRPDLGANQTSDHRFDGSPRNRLHHQDVNSLPTDPGKLFGVLQARAEVGDPSNPVDFRMLEEVAEILRETVAPPELRAAAYRVAGRIPGIELVGEVTDPVGRRGVAVAITADYNGLRRLELVFDPETSMLQAEREILLERIPELDAAPPVVVGYNVYLASGFVDSMSERVEDPLVG
jgi:hypothetical protein